MVKKSFFIALATISLNLFPAVFLMAGEFTATVSTSQVHLSESFVLNLTLKDASSKGTPDFTSLQEHFSIHSQKHLNNTTFINGKITSSITWKLALTPKIEGVLEIPSITVDTAEGPLSTQPLTLDVIKETHPTSSVDTLRPNIIAKVNNPSPYKNESFIYTALLTSKMPLYNLQTQKLQMKDAIVEHVGEPRLEEKAIDGVLLNVVEFTYLITPLKAGSLTIPSIAVQGAVPQKRKGQSEAFFDNDLDPFGMMQGFDLLKPFSLLTKEIQLDVQPAIADVNPWLPAKALIIEEQWLSDQALRVGEPFSRSLMIKAEGLKASLLPNLGDLQNQNSSFKIYADKPEESEQILQGILHSKRKEQFTIIPQQAGTWTLPEISIVWWDSVKKEKRSSTIPARTLQILPVLGDVTPVSEEIANPASIPTTEASKTSSSHPYLLYGIISLLSFLLLAALFWGFTLQRKIAGLTQDSVQKPKMPHAAKPKNSESTVVREVQKNKKEKLPDLNPT
jgi:hypothetical protein